VTRPTRARRFAVAGTSESQEVSPTTSPTVEHGAPGAMLPSRSKAALRRGSAVAVPVQGADPALTTPKARLSELGTIFATGYRRGLLPAELPSALGDSEAE
jgi:hypothetical protein